MLKITGVFIGRKRKKNWRCRPSENNESDCRNHDSAYRNGPKNRFCLADIADHQVHTLRSFFPIAPRTEPPRLEILADLIAEKILSLRVNRRPIVKPYL
ncbi:MAG: hypothetical protein ACLSA6_05555 [Holdemania massiliensis]